MGHVPVLLLHGARVSRTMWEAQVVALEAAGHQALAIDLPGHGTRVAERFTVDEALATVDAAARSFDTPPLLVGLSLGGYLGITHAARHPESVAGLVAAGCSTVPDQPATVAWREAARLIARLPDRGAWLNRTLVDRALPPEGARAAGAGGFALDVMVDLLTEMPRLRTLEDLAAVRCPVWLVNGRWDHFRAQERAYLRASPQARRVLVPGATHLVNLVRPVAFSRVLLEVIDELGDAAATPQAPTPGTRPAQASSSAA